MSDAGFCSRREADRLIEKGNHEELINLKGTYYKMYTGIFE